MATISPSEYNNLLAQLADANPVTYAPISKDSVIVDIDLSTRLVDVPEFLSVELDHRAETIYFRCNRFNEAVDLSTKACIIQYVNAGKEGRIYTVPYYDLATFRDDSKMLIPWQIGGEATKYAGKIKFTIKFFSVDPGTKAIKYSLNTIPATGVIANGMSAEEIENYDFGADALAELQASIATINNLIQTGDRNDNGDVITALNLFWIDL